jgi:hypothetical protein
MDIASILKKDPEIWDLFTRSEEYRSSIRDKYDRFTHSASKNRDILEPKVSEYLIQNGFHPEYPDQKPFAVCLSHDIDELYRTIRTKAAMALVLPNENRFTAVQEAIPQMRSKKLPLWNFSDIMALEEKYGARSSFYFMVQERGDPDYNYPIRDCKTIVGELSDGGWEVGLHGGHTTYKNQAEMKEKKQKLEKVLNKSVVGYRNHYLRFKVPDTWENLYQAGFLYDTTLGYNDCVGFRGGICHPFRPFNLTSGNEVNLLEIPLTIMDTTLFGYMNLDLNASWEIVRQLIDTVEKYHGTISILWHNSSFFGDQRKFYETILKYCREKNAWMASGKEVAQWWMHHVR